MDSDNKNNLNDSNEVLGENNFKMKVLILLQIRDGDQRYLKIMIHFLLLLK